MCTPLISVWELFTVFYCYLRLHNVTQVDDNLSHYCKCDKSFHLKPKMDRCRLQMSEIQAKISEFFERTQPESGEGVIS